MDFQPKKIDNNWSVVEKRWKLKEARHWETLLSLGTGYITTRGSLDEGLDDDDQAMEYDRKPDVVTLEKIPSAKTKWGTYMPAIGAMHPYLSIGIVNLPFYLGLEISIDNEKLNMERSKHSQYKRWLDMKTATQYRTFIWQTKKGKKAELKFRRYMNPADRFICVQECTVKMLSGSGKITVTSFVDNDVRTNGYDKFSKHNVGAKGELLFSDITTNLNNRVVTASRAVHDQGSAWKIIKGARRINAQTTFTLSSLRKACIKKVSATVADNYFKADELLMKASRLIFPLIKNDITPNYKQHKKIWADHWERSDIRIKSEESKGYNSQNAIRQAIYHLIRARSDKEYRGQYGPKCSTGDGYVGGLFWDMEIFFLPFYLYTNPKAAATTVRFRHRCLPAARDLAKYYGYKGAKYPWTSSFKGTESCVMWEFPDH